MTRQRAATAGFALAAGTALAQCAAAPLLILDSVVVTANRIERLGPEVPASCAP